MMTATISIPMTIAMSGVIRPSLLAKPYPVMAPHTDAAPITDPHHRSFGNPPIDMTPDISISCHRTHNTINTMITTMIT